MSQSATGTRCVMPSVSQHEATHPKRLYCSETVSAFNCSMQYKIRANVSYCSPSLAAGRVSHTLRSCLHGNCSGWVRLASGAPFVSIPGGVGFFCGLFHVVFPGQLRSCEKKMTRTGHHTKAGGGGRTYQDVQTLFLLSREKECEALDNREEAVKSVKI